MDFLEFCPQDGAELVPSRVMRRMPGWYECPTCGRVYGEPDLEDPQDDGVVLEPYKDFDPDPGRSRLQIKGGSSSKRRRKSDRRVKGGIWFPLPLPRQGESIASNR